jgi:hypothetical protein
MNLYVLDTDTLQLYQDENPNQDGALSTVGRGFSSNRSRTLNSRTLPVSAIRLYAELISKCLFQLQSKLPGGHFVARDDGVFLCFIFIVFEEIRGKQQIDAFGALSVTARPYDKLESRERRDAILSR